jgi:hypothetical protein
MDDQTTHEVIADIESHIGGDFRTYIGIGFDVKTTSAAATSGVKVLPEPSIMSEDGIPRVTIYVDGREAEKFEAHLVFETEGDADLPLPDRSVKILLMPTMGHSGTVEVCQ